MRVEVGVVELCGRQVFAFGPPACLPRIVAIHPAVVRPIAPPRGQTRGRGCRHGRPRQLTRCCCPGRLRPEDDGVKKNIFVVVRIQAYFAEVPAEIAAFVFERVDVYGYPVGAAIGCFIQTAGCGKGINVTALHFIGVLCGYGKSCTAHHTGGQPATEFGPVGAAVGRFVHPCVRAVDDGLLVAADTVPERSVKDLRIG